MKEKKKKRKSWMNRIVAFLTTVCLACVTFVCPVLADNSLYPYSSGYTFRESYSGGSATHLFTVNFSDADVIMFVMTFGDSFLDSSGNPTVSLFDVFFVSQNEFSGNYSFSTVIVTFSPLMSQSLV